MTDRIEQVKEILHDAIYWGCKHEPCPDTTCEQCALNRIDALYKSQMPTTKKMIELIDSVSKSFYAKYSGKGLSPSEVKKLHKSEYWDLIRELLARYQ